MKCAHSACGREFVPSLTRHARKYCCERCRDAAAVQRYHNKPAVRAKRNAYYRAYWRRKRESTNV